MAVHDLTHFAVETALGFDDAFFGLVAAGWDLADFEDKAKRVTMPENARLVEVIVGQLDLERLPANQRTHAEFHEAVTMALAGQGLAVPDALTGDGLTRVRTRRAELVAQWSALEPGDFLELTYP